MFSRKNFKDFDESYPKLYQYLGTTFPVEELGPSSLEDAIVGWVDEGHSKIVQEARHLLEAEPFPWRGLSHASSMYFQSEQSAKNWLRELIEIMQIAIDKDTAEFSE